MAHNVICQYCKEKFDRDKEPFVEVKNRRYAHKSCYDKYQANLSKEEKDLLALEDYIKKTFPNIVTPKVKAQISKFNKEYGYTYSGIMKALIYYYEIKGNKFDFAKTNGGIGIVPFVYEKAYNYYYSIWEAQQVQQRQLSESSSIDVYIPKTIEVHIPVPQREERKRKLFTFLDEEEEENN